LKFAIKLARNTVLNVASKFKYTEHMELLHGHYNITQTQRCGEI